MEKQEEKTMRLSEDPRFIEHVKKQIDKVRLYIRNFEEEAKKKGNHRKRDGWDRFCEMRLNEPSSCAREYELCLMKQSGLPATVRRVVTHIGANALNSFARALAEENKEAKEGEDGNS